jgi:hypothetical protein
LVVDVQRYHSNFKEASQYFLEMDGSSTLVRQ